VSHYEQDPEVTQMKKAGKVLGILMLLGVVLFLAVQLIRPGPLNSRPPVVGEPAWGDRAAEDLARRACYDCHSNETHWPWYAQIAPASWLVTYDVTEARARMNFSEWAPARGRLVSAAAAAVRQGERPPLQYWALHPEARLTPQEKQTLAAALEALR
jgi:hypothetical protein